MPDLHNPRTWVSREGSYAYRFGTQVSTERRCPACGQWIADTCPETYYALHKRVPDTAALQHVQEAHPPPPPDPSWAAWWPVPL